MTAVLPCDTVAARPAPRPRSLFARRDFRLLWIGETTSSLGSNVTSVALPLVAIGVLHAGVVAVSVLTAAAWLPWLVIGLPAGAWIDRFRRRPVMIACDVVSLAAFASVPLARWLGVLTMTQLLLVGLIAGVAKVFFSTAYRTFLPVLVAPEDLVRANSNLQSAESGTQVFGPGLGGLLAQAFGAANGLLADAASFAVSLTCLLRVHADEPRIERERRALTAEIADGLRFVLRDRLLRVLISFGAASNLALTAYDAIILVFLVREIGLSPAAAGLLFAVGSLGGVAGALCAPRLGRRIGSARAMLVCKTGLTPLTLLLPLTHAGWGLTFFLVGTVAMVSGVVAGNVLSAGFMQAYCPPALRGRITSCASVINYSSIPLGALIGGTLAASLGFRPALWLIFGLFVGAGVLLLASPLARMRDLPTRAPEPS